MLTLDFLIRNLTVILDKKKVTDDYNIGMSNNIFNY